MLERRDTCAPDGRLGKSPEGKKYREPGKSVRYGAVVCPTKPKQHMVFPWKFIPPFLPELDVTRRRNGKIIPAPNRGEWALRQPAFTLHNRQTVGWANRRKGRVIASRDNRFLLERRFVQHSQKGSAANLWKRIPPFLPAKGNFQPAVLLPLFRQLAPGGQQQLLMVGY